MTLEEQWDPYLRNRLPQAQLVEAARSALGEIVAADEKILFAVVTDMSLGGTYTDTWVVLTDHRLLAYTPELPDQLQQVRCDEIVQLNVEHFVGNGMLSVETPEKTIHLARFSRKLSLDVEDAVADMEALLEDQGAVNFARTHDTAKKIRLKKMEKDSNRCPKCGRIMMGSVCQYCLEKGKLIRRMLSYIKPYYPQAILSTVLLIINGGLSMVQPFLTGRLVDDVLMTSNYTRLAFMVALLAGTHLLNAGISGVRSYVVAWLGQRVIRDIRSSVFQHLQYLRMEYFDSVRTGAVMSRVTNDTQNLQNFVVQSSQELLLQVVMVIGVGAVMFRYDWRLALVTLVPMPLIVYAARVSPQNTPRVSGHLDSPGTDELGASGSFRNSGS